ncbi:DUF4190 domain-containing protein [Streptomyces xanthochromogenes]|uniref:DUF4190 domain-containing protein n=1 Tax=Streptomyces xanthochromogenes TaxID=67384 RepID=UPI0038289791
MSTTGDAPGPYVQGCRNEVERPENRALRISFYGAITAVLASSGSMWTSGAVIYMPLTTAWFLFVEGCSITAVVAGHRARRQAKRHGLPGRWWALLSITTGWLCGLAALLVMLLVSGVTLGIMAVFLS